MTPKTARSYHLSEQGQAYVDWLLAEEAAGVPEQDNIERQELLEELGDLDICADDTDDADYGEHSPEED